MTGSSNRVQNISADLSNWENCVHVALKNSDKAIVCRGNSYKVVNRSDLKGERAVSFDDMARISRKKLNSFSNQSNFIHSEEEKSKLVDFSNNLLYLKKLSSLPSKLSEKAGRMLGVNRGNGLNEDIDQSVKMCKNLASNFSTVESRSQVEGECRAKFSYENLSFLVIAGAIEKIKDEEPLTDDEKKELIKHFKEEEEAFAIPEADVGKLVDEILTESPKKARKVLGIEFTKTNDSRRDIGEIISIGLLSNVGLKPLLKLLKKVFISTSGEQQVNLSEGEREIAMKGDLEGSINEIKAVLDLNTD